MSDTNAPIPPVPSVSVAVSDLKSAVIAAVDAHVEKVRAQASDVVSAIQSDGTLAANTVSSLSHDLQHAVENAVADHLTRVRNEAESVVTKVANNIVASAKTDVSDVEKRIEAAYEEGRADALHSAAIASTWGAGELKKVEADWKTHPLVVGAAVVAVGLTGALLLWGLKHVGLV